MKSINNFPVKTNKDDAVETWILDNPIGKIIPHKTGIIATIFYIGLQKEYAKLDV